MSSPFDPGLQPERTALAWQRTLLALAVGMLASSRGLLPLVGTAAYAIAGAGVVVLVVLMITVRRRYRSVHDGLTATSGSMLPGGGRLIAVTAVLTTVCGIAAIVFVLSNILDR